MVDFPIVIASKIDRKELDVADTEMLEMQPRKCHVLKTAMPTKLTSHLVK